jgi:hypothetical protein
MCNQAHVARTALAAEPPAPAVPDEVRAAFAELERRQENLHYFRDLRKELAAEPPAPDPREALAARPLLEAVARLGDRIGQHTVAEITTISDRAAAWLRENPPGQPVAIEPRGCPTPGACSCVEAPAPAEPDTDAVLTLAAIIREAAGNGLPGAARLAELILSHPKVASVFQPPAPAPAADGEREELAAPINQIALAWEPDVCLLSNMTASQLARTAALLRQPAPAPAADGERDHVPGAGNMVPAAYAARLRQCPTHGQLPANAWGCPECLRELREELARLRAPATDGEREELAADLDECADSCVLAEKHNWAQHMRRAAALLREPASAPAPEAGEAEELAQWLDSKGRGAWPCPDGFSAEAEAEEYEMFSGLTRAAALLRQLPPEGLSAEEYYHIDSGARIVREPSEEWSGGCWVVSNSRHVNPCTEFPSLDAAWAALQQARRQEAGDE